MTKKTLPAQDGVYRTLTIRAGVTEPSIPRGTYQLLSDAQRVGWHLDFKERLRRLLEDQEMAP